MNSANSHSILPHLSCKYAFFVRYKGQLPVFDANSDSFSAASLIKIPILLAWASLEQTGEISLDEICDLDAEPQVKGAGFSRSMRTRQISYHDVLLMMIATSDNLCTNLAILCEPFLPFTSSKLRKMMGLPERKWNEAGNPDLLVPGHQIGPAEYLFERIECPLQ